MGAAERGEGTAWRCVPLTLTNGRALSLETRPLRAQHASRVSASVRPSVSSPCLKTKQHSHCWIQLIGFRCSCCSLMLHTSGTAFITSEHVSCLTQPPSQIYVCGLAKGQPGLSASDTFGSWIIEFKTDLRWCNLQSRTRSCSLVPMTPVSK
jgi:hypothetical protein